MTEQTQAFSMNAEIAAAVCQVMGKVRQLGKSEKNKYDNYDFVSVDKFLAAVNPLCAEAGLFVIHQEVGHDYYTNKKESLWMRVTFDFYLCHTSGSVCGPFQRCVAVPMTGAQSYGSAQSYALKQFFRALFLIPTGDKDDADFNTKDEHQAAPKDYTETPAPDGTVPTDPGLRTGVKGADYSKCKTDAERAAESVRALVGQMREAKTEIGVDGVWRKNEPVIRGIKSQFPDEYENLVDATKARKAAIREPEYEEPQDAAPNWTPEDA